MINKDKLLDWAVWAIIIIVIVLFILHIVGDSPTLDQIAVGALAGFLIKIYSKLDRIDRKVTEHDFRIKNLEENK